MCLHATKLLNIQRSFANRYVICNNFFLVPVQSNKYENVTEKCDTKLSNLLRLLDRRLGLRSYPSYRRSLDRIWWGATNTHK